MKNLQQFISETTSNLDNIDLINFAIALKNELKAMKEEILTKTIGNDDGEEKQKRNPILEEFRKTISEETKQSVEIEMLKQDVEYYKAKYEKCIETIRKFDPGIIGMYDL